MSFEVRTNTLVGYSKDNPFARLNETKRGLRLKHNPLLTKQQRFSESIEGRLGVQPLKSVDRFIFDLRTGGFGV